MLRFSSPSSWCCLPSPPSLSALALSSFAWCCLPSPHLGVAAFSPSSVGWCFFVSSFFGWCFWVGLLFPSLLLGGAVWPPSLGGVASGPFSFCVVLPSFSPFWWCCFLSPLPFGCCLASFVERCCVVPSPFAWCRLPFPPSLGGARFSPLFCWVVLSTFSSFRWGCFPSLFCWLVLPSFLPPSGGAPLVPLFCWVVLLCLPLWVVLRLALSSFAWCCLPSPPLGGAAFGWCRLASLFRWCCVWPSLLLRGAAFLLHIWVWLLSPPLLLEGAALPSLSLGGVLGGATFPFSSVEWCRLASLFGWCCVWPSLLLRGAAFLSLLPWVGLVSLPSSVGWCCPPSPPLGGDAFPPSSVGWCCLPSPPLGGAAFSLLFPWVVLLGLLRWVVLRYSLSFLRGPSLGGSLSKRKIKKIQKNEVKNKKKKQRETKRKTKRRNQKKRKN